MDTKMKSKPQSKMTSPTRLTASDTRKSVHQKPHLLMKKKDSIVDKDDLVGQVCKSVFYIVCCVGHIT